MENIIEALNISKIYKRPIRSTGIRGSIRDLFIRKYENVVAVDCITLNVKKGECIGYIGPNGAGKSTSIKILTGILQASSGSVRVLGLDPFKNRKEYTKQIGVVFGQRTQLWWDIAVKESFNLLKRIYQVPDVLFNERLEEFTSMFDVSDLLNTPVRKLSLGQRMKCDLIASLLHNPSVLFLDEPTIGLDAIAKESIRTFLKKLAQKGETTILLTTHDLQEIEELCQRIIVLDHGKIVYDGDLHRIKQLGGALRNLVLEWESSSQSCELSGNERIEDLKNNNAIKNLQLLNNGLQIDFNPHELSVPELLSRISLIAPIRDLKITEPSIEEVIKRLYSKGFTSNIDT